MPMVNDLPAGTEFLSRPEAVLESPLAEISGSEPVYLVYKMMLLAEPYILIEEIPVFLNSFTGKV